MTVCFSGLKGFLGYTFKSRTALGKLALIGHCSGKPSLV